jgi:6-phosphofructokinase
MDEDFHLGTHSNLIIGQAGGATAVVNASLVGAFEAATNSACFEHIYGMWNGIQGFLQEHILDLSQQPADLWSQLMRTPSAALGSCRYKLQENDPERIIALFRQYDIHALLYIGGNDSADTTHRIALEALRQGYELRAISIPKTIDNDLPLTDHCPGYGSAARFIAMATMDSAMNTLSMPWHYPVKIIETMGRDAGWLTAAAALGKRDERDAPHILLLPEQRFNPDRYLTQVEEVYRRFGCVVVVAAETLRDEQGVSLGARGQLGTDDFQHPLVSGAAQYLVELVKEHLKVRARFDKPGDLQRMASFCVSRVDRAEAYQVGQAGIKAILDDETDKLVILIRQDEPEYHSTTGLAELARVANVQRTMPTEYLDESKTMVTPAFTHYALPLIGERLPVYPRLD